MFNKWTIFSFSYLLIWIPNYLPISSHVVPVYAARSYQISIVLLVQWCFDNNFINQNRNMYVLYFIVIMFLFWPPNIHTYVFSSAYFSCDPRHVPPIGHKSVVFPLFCPQKTNNSVCCCFLYTLYACCGILLYCLLMMILWT